MKKLTQEEMQEEIERLSLQMDEVERRIRGAREHVENDDHEFDEVDVSPDSHKTLLVVLVLIIFCVAYNIFH